MEDLPNKVLADPEDNIFCLFNELTPLTPRNNILCDFYASLNCGVEKLFEHGK